MKKQYLNLVLIPLIGSVLLGTPETLLAQEHQGDCIGDAPNGSIPELGIGSQQEIEKRLGNRTLKAFTMWPMGDLYQLVLPDPESLVPEESLVVEGVMVKEDGTPWGGMPIYLFPVNNEGTAAIYFHGSEEGTGVMGCLTPTATSDEQGRFIITTGPWWVMADVVVVGALWTKSAAGLVQAQLRASVDDGLKEFVTKLSEGQASYEVVAITPVVQGEGILTVPISADNNRIDLGRIVMRMVK